MPKPFDDDENEIDANFDVELVTGGFDLIIESQGAYGVDDVLATDRIALEIDDIARAAMTRDGPLSHADVLALQNLAASMSRLAARAVSVAGQIDELMKPRGLDIVARLLERSKDAPARD